MDQELKTIVDRMTSELRAWLEKPSPADEKVEQIRKELAALKGQLGAGIVGETLKTLERADAEARRSRQREAAEAIALRCKEIGVMLEAREPPKRKRRAKGGKAAPAETSAGSRRGRGLKEWETPRGREHAK